METCKEMKIQNGVGYGVHKSDKKIIREKRI
jgi:hypothetical protein